MEFGQTHARLLGDILRWRRDVRHFLPDPLPEAVLERLASPPALPEEEN